MKIAVLSAAVLGAMLAGCEHDHDLSLAQRQMIPRAQLTQEPLTPRPGSSAPRPPEMNINDLKPSPEQIVGTYIFTTPATVKQVKSGVGSFSKYELYSPNAKDTDRPLVVIEIGPDVVSAAANGLGDLKAEATRVYMLNALRAEEWTGKTKEGHPFCELIVSHGDNGDRLHALGVASDAASRQIVLDILGSIKWEPKK